MQKYTIVISDEQRQMLIDALETLNDISEDRPLLIGMLRDIEGDDTINDFTA